jgi:gas vesicle structural protein
VTTAVQPAGRGGGAPSPSGLADVIDTILDKGLVIDAYVRVAVAGIEVLTVDARVVIASVDTYLRFAEAVNRLDVTQDKKGLQDLAGGSAGDGAKRKAKGVVEGAVEAAGDVLREFAGSQRQRSPSRSQAGS